MLVSAIIFSLGVIVCLVGVGVSASTGEQIYSSKIGEERGYTYKFTDIDKVKIKVDEADINIYGGCKESYIEIINFNENLCSYTGNNSMITFREATEVEDITGIWESGLSFKGLRYILRPVAADKQKTVNIYLEKDEHIKAFDLELSHGNVTVTDIKTVTDYHISLDDGKVTFRDVSTGSAVDIEAVGDVSSDIKLERVDAEMLTVSAKRAKLSGEGFSVGQCELRIALGSVDFEYLPKTEDYTVEINTKGKLTVDGVLQPDRFVYPSGGGSVDTENPDGEEIQVSSLKIAGDDLYVDIETPGETEETKAE